MNRFHAPDVATLLRNDSAAFGHWAAFDLDADSMRAVFIPEGCAHGFLTLTPDTDLLYHMGRMFAAGKAKGYRWNDQKLNIRWPAEPAFISPADRTWPDFSFKTGSSSPS